MTPTVALTIAGSDSGGGAGIQADLKTFAAHGVFGTSAITAVTAQNTRGVTGIVAIDPAFVLAQVQAVLDDLRPRAVKTGMLASGATINAVAALAERGALERLVVDPVLVSSTGHRLVDELGVDAYRTRLLPLAIVATPNLREAAVLTGRLLEDLGSVEAMVAAAEELRALGADTVVVKGGHLAQAVGAGTASATTPSPDVVVGPGGPVVLEGDRVVTATTTAPGAPCRRRSRPTWPWGWPRWTRCGRPRTTCTGPSSARPPGDSAAATDRSTTSAGRGRPGTRQGRP